MLRTSLDDVMPGMRLALPVFHPNAAGRVLLRAGFELEARTIGRLADLGVRALWIAYPQLSFLLKHASPEVTRHRASLSSQVAFLFDQLRERSDAAFEYTKYARSVAGLAEALVADPDAALFVDRLSRVSEHEFEHASTVGFLSTLMGLKLIPYLEHQRTRVRPAKARDVVPLGVAGMLHDIGMTRLREEDRAAFRREPDPSDETYRSHVELGHRMVRGRVPATVAAAVLHHHQRCDGTGFPARQMADGRTEPIAGDRIHVYARIIAVADVFDRLTRDDEGGERPRVRALAGLLEQTNAGKFDRMAFCALLAVCPPYPPGTMVTLSDGVRGVVVGWNDADPCRPRVQPFDPLDPEKSVDRPVVDLSASRGICVAVADGADVGRENFYPSRPTEFMLDVANRRLHNAAETERARAGEAGRRGGLRDAG
ncbi:MAG: HD domain-containing phosphohydrolase [Planctomycetota bacterium]